MASEYTAVGAPVLLLFVIIQATTIVAVNMLVITTLKLTTNSMIRETVKVLEAIA
jgi:hypothetical protein